jgi:hypothetical protein
MVRYDWRELEMIGKEIMVQGKMGSLLTQSPFFQGGGS